MRIYFQYFKTRYGELVIGDFNGQLCLCDWRYRKMRQAIDDRIMKGLKSEFEMGETMLIVEAQAQLAEYFLKQRTTFSLPLLLVGTTFQKEVWNELLAIPYGTTETYLGLAERLNNPKAVRAVASANGANALSIIIPCHRVVGSHGDMVGYAGGLETKQKLLRLENPEYYSQQLELF